ncbi:unnamed protein product [Trichogramma brassicae]|uniref:Uncharacterized protein n=1 Tax=Trichogramma brassicae TaxID=86971 RepID=A0A6H5J294_9HYME|nr:unnamed protein product [Trichogramma brassicae]
MIIRMKFYFESNAALFSPFPCNVIKNVRFLRHARGCFAQTKKKKKYYLKKNFSPCMKTTRRLRHYRSGLRALRRGRRPRQRGSVAQPEQHDLSASRAASRRGAGEIHSRAAEQGRGGARRQALLRTICPVKKCRLHANSLKEEIVPTRFRAREYQTAVRDLLGTFCNVNRLVDYVNYPLEPSEYWWQLEEQLSQELDGIDTIFGNLMAPLSSCGIVGTVDVHQPSFGYNLALYLVVLTVNIRLILNLFYQDDNGANRFPKITSMPSSSWLSCSSGCHQYSAGSSG